MDIYIYFVDPINREKISTYDNNDVNADAKQQKWQELPGERRLLTSLLLSEWMIMQGGTS